MTQAALRPPPYLQPRPKAIPTLSDSSTVAGALNSTPPRLSRPSSPSRGPSPARPHTVVPDASEKAVRAFIRRALCPDANTGPKEQRPIDELLPPLTSSNDIDLQLYAIIAVVVKELVYSWYGKITPDQVFVEEVVRIIAHCTRAIEGRLRSVDLEGLVLDEIPELIENHVHAYRTSHARVHDPALSTNPRAIYHSLQPHPALSPVPDVANPSMAAEQSEHETQYGQLIVQSALAVLLPTEDLENACLRTLVADVVAESILGKAIGGKMSEGYFIWGSITKIVTLVKARLEPQATGEEMEVDTRSRLEKFGLLSERGEATGPKADSRRFATSALFWMILQYGYMLFVAVQFVVQGFIAALSGPRRSASYSNRTASSPTWASQQPLRPARPILDHQIFSLLSAILDLPLRMPWLAGALSLLHYNLVTGPFELAATDGIIDQFVHLHLLPILSPRHVPAALATLRQTLFPNLSMPPPSPPPPSPSEALETRRTCALSLLSLLPPFILHRVFPGLHEEGRVKEIEGELDVWGDSYLNKHLLYAIVELVIVRVLPEVAERGVREGMEARGAL